MQLLPPAPEPPMETSSCLPVNPATATAKIYCPNNNWRFRVHGSQAAYDSSKHVEVCLQPGGQVAGKPSLGYIDEGLVIREWVPSFERQVPAIIEKKRSDTERKITITLLSLSVAPGVCEFPGPETDSNTKTDQSYRLTGSPAADGDQERRR